MKSPKEHTSDFGLSLSTFDPNISKSTYEWLRNMTTLIAWIRDLTPGKLNHACCACLYLRMGMSMIVHPCPCICLLKHVLLAPVPKGHIDRYIHWMHDFAHLLRRESPWVCHVRSPRIINRILFRSRDVHLKALKIFMLLDMPLEKSTCEEKSLSGGFFSKQPWWGDPEFNYFISHCSTPHPHPTSHPPTYPA